MAEFNRWYVLANLSYSDMPQNNDSGFVYILRRRSNREILYIGSTDELYHRLFINYIGGRRRKKTKRIHNELMNNLEANTVEVSWNEYPDQILSEKKLVGEYLARYGCLPVWNAMEQAIKINR